MTTKSGARVYRGPGTAAVGGACPHCHQACGLTQGGRRRRHRDQDGRACTGGGIVVEAPSRVPLSTIPPVVMPTKRRGRPARVKLDDSRQCLCGWRPRRKGDGTFEAHRIRPDDPTAPYCANGSERSRR